MSSNNTGRVREMRSYNQLGAATHKPEVAGRRGIDWQIAQHMVGRGGECADIVALAKNGGTGKNMTAHQTVKNPREFHRVFGANHLFFRDKIDKNDQ